LTFCTFLLFKCSKSGSKFLLKRWKRHTRTLSTQLLSAHKTLYNTLWSKYHVTMLSHILYKFNCCTKQASSFYSTVCTGTSSVTRTPRTHEHEHEHTARKQNPQKGTIDRRKHRNKTSCTSHTSIAKQAQAKHNKRDLQTPETPQ